MKLFMLMLAAAIAGTVLFACAPPTAAQVCTGGNLNPVPFVATPYAPATNATPTPQNRPINDDVQTDLAGAFAGASPAFQTQLSNSLAYLSIRAAVRTRVRATPTTQPHATTMVRSLLTLRGDFEHIR